MTTATASSGIVVEAIESTPWASLTFAGERHHVVVRLPGATRVRAVDGADLAVAGAIIAVERADWTALAGGTLLTLDVLAIAVEGEAMSRA